MAAPAQIGAAPAGYGLCGLSGELGRSATPHAASLIRPEITCLAIPN
jgi:hypothetical protein